MQFKFRNYRGESFSVPSPGVWLGLLSVDFVGAETVTAVLLTNRGTGTSEDINNNNNNKTVIK